MRLYAAMRLTLDMARYGEIAAMFPEIDTDTWRPGLVDPIPPDPAPVLAWRKVVIEAVNKEHLSPRAIRQWYRHRPREFIEHWGTTYDPRNAGLKEPDGTPLPAKMPMLLFKRQRECLDFLIQCLDSQTSGLIEKCRELGCTWLACFISVWMWGTWEEGPAIGWGSRKEDEVDIIGEPRSIFEKMRICIRNLPPFLLPNGFSDKDHLTFMKCINVETGATISGESGDNIGRGGRTRIYWKDESAHYERPEKIEASLSENTRVQIDISSVNGLGNVFHRRREAGRDWIPGQPMDRTRTAVFVFDWRDHPAKTKEWYEARRKKFTDEGMLHIFKQEIDRDYASSVEGVIIKAEWVKAAIDAHLTLGLDDSGGWSVGLDVGDDEAGDGNALAAFKGIVLRRVDAWGEIDAGAATRRTIQNVEAAGITDADIQYDCVGVGAAVKAEANRLADTIDEDGFSLLPEGLNFIPWNAGARVLNPDDPINPDDRDSPTNKNMFANFVAQAWWMVARRFERTYRAVEDGIHYDSSELISIDSTIPSLREVERELSQPTMKKRPSDMKLLRDKRPEGTKSPNRGDAIIMAAYPLTGLRPVYATAIPEFQMAPFKVPDFWPKGYAMMVESSVTSVLWGAYDKDQDILYITTEHVRSNAEASINAQAIAARGKWIPGILDSDEMKMEARQEMAAIYWAHELQVVLADRAYGAGVSDVAQRIASGRLKAFSTCQRFFREYRSHRRDEEGKVIGKGLMDCVRMLARPTTILAMKPKPTIIQPAILGYGRPAPAHRGDRRAGY